jgi:spore maturation protein CgeB
MKILIIGSDYKWSIERIFVRELYKLSHQVFLIPVQNWYLDFYQKSIFNKVFVRLGLINLEKRIQQKLINEVKNYEFDIICVFKGMEIQYKTLLYLKKHTERLINFNPDSPFIFSGVGSGNKNITQCLHLYDEHITYDKYIKEKIESQFSKKCTLVSFGFDFEGIKLGKFNSDEEILAVCFVGNPDHYRAAILYNFLQSGICLHVYGHNWSRYVKHPNIFIHEPVYGTDYFETLRKYRLQLNIMRKHNLDSHNMRSIEIPGCGGIMLAPRTKDHLAFFDEGVEAFFYDNNIQLISITKSILNMNKSEAQRIRNLARNKVLNHFSYSKIVSLFI